MKFIVIITPTCQDMLKKPTLHSILLLLYIKKVKLMEEEYSSTLIMKLSSGAGRENTKYKIFYFLFYTYVYM